MCWEDNTCAAWRWAEDKYEQVEAWEEFDLKTRVNTFVVKGWTYSKTTLDPEEGGWEKVHTPPAGTKDSITFRRLRIGRKGYCGLAGKPNFFRD
jgi:hypothetical protein